MTTLVKVANPVITSIPNTAQAGTAGRRSVVKVGNKYYMVYEVSTAKLPGAAGFEGAAWSSAMASSADLVNWTLFSQNPILPQTAQSAGFGNDGPSFFNVGAFNYVYYRVSESTPHTLRALIANEATRGFDSSWNMTSTGIGHLIGRVDGDGWSANGSQDAASFLQFGPYYAGLATGDHIATWKFMIDNNTSDNAQQVRLEVADTDNNDAIIAQRNITRQQWKQTSRYEYFSVPFTLTSAQLNHRLEFRVWWYGQAFIREGIVGVN